VTGCKRSSLVLALFVVNRHCAVALLIALLLPRFDLMLDGFDIANTTIETLTSQNRQLGFDHVEPTALFGGEVASALENPVSFGWWKGLIQRCWVYGY